MTHDPKRFNISKWLLSITFKADRKFDLPCRWFVIFYNEAIKTCGDSTSIVSTSVPVSVSASVYFQLQCQLQFQFQIQFSFSTSSKINSSFGFSFYQVSASVSTPGSVSVSALISVSISVQLQFQLQLQFRANLQIYQTILLNYQPTDLRTNLRSYASQAQP